MAGGFQKPGCPPWKSSRRGMASHGDTFYISVLWVSDWDPVQSSCLVTPPPGAQRPGESPLYPFLRSQYKKTKNIPECLTSTTPLVWPWGLTLQGSGESANTSYVPGTIPRPSCPSSHPLQKLINSSYSCFLHFTNERPKVVQKG